MTWMAQILVVNICSIIVFFLHHIQGTVSWDILLRGFFMDQFSFGLTDYPNGAIFHVYQLWCWHRRYKLFIGVVDTTAWTTMDAWWLQKNGGKKSIKVPHMNLSATGKQHWRSYFVSDLHWPPDNETSVRGCQQINRKTTKKLRNFATVTKNNQFWGF